MVEVCGEHLIFSLLFLGQIVLKKESILNSTYLQESDIIFSENSIGKSKLYAQMLLPKQSFTLCFSYIFIHMDITWVNYNRVKHIHTLLNISLWIFKLLKNHIHGLLGALKLSALPQKSSITFQTQRS